MGRQGGASGDFRPTKSSFPTFRKSQKFENERLSYKFKNSIIIL